ncbi:MAG: hypothetical protein WDN31_21550 [Hyphomicrobium sp.]
MRRLQRCRRPCRGPAGLWSALLRLRLRAPDAIPLAVGEESRTDGVAWVGAPEAVAHLLTVGRDTGLELALAHVSVAERRAAIRERFKPQLDALSRAGAAYVFGAKRLGSVVGDGLRRLGYQVAGYLDNNPASWGTHTDGAAISGVSDALDRALPVIIGTTRFPFTLTRQLSAAGFATSYPTRS